MFSRPKFYYQHASYFHLNNYMGFDVPKEDYLTGGLDPKVKDVKNWVQNGDSSPEAKALAKALQTELETIKNSTDKKLIELYAEVFENIGIKDNYDAKEGQPIVVDDTYDKKGVLSVLEQNCPMLKVQFSLYPDHRYLAYASATKAASNIDYLPMGSTITLLDGVVTVTRPMKDAEGKEKMETVSFELFPWDVQKAMEAKAKAIEAKAAAKEAEVDLGGSGVGAQNVTPSGETPAETQAPGVGPSLDLDMPGGTGAPLNPAGRASGELGEEVLPGPLPDRVGHKPSVKPLGSEGVFEEENTELTDKKDGLESEEKKLTPEEKLAVKLMTRLEWHVYQLENKTETAGVLQNGPKGDHRQAIKETLMEITQATLNGKATLTEEQKRVINEVKENPRIYSLDERRAMLAKEWEDITKLYQADHVKAAGWEIRSEALFGKENPSMVLEMTHANTDRKFKIEILVPTDVDQMPITWKSPAITYKGREVGIVGRAEGVFKASPTDPINAINKVINSEAERAVEEEMKKAMKQPQPSNESSPQ